MVRAIGAVIVGTCAVLGSAFQFGPVPVSRSRALYMSAAGTGPGLSYDKDAVKKDPNSSNYR